MMLVVVIIRTVAVLCGLGAVLPTAFLAWVAIDDCVNHPEFYARSAPPPTSIAAPARR